MTWKDYERVLNIELPASTLDRDGKLRDTCLKADRRSVDDGGGGGERAAPLPRAPIGAMIS